MQAMDGDMEILHRFFEHQADSNPENIALICQDAVVTYQDLEERSNKWANLLKQKGIGAGDIVALLLPRSVDLYAMILAILKVGGAYLPLDPEYPPQRIEYILSDCQVKGLVTLNELASRLKGINCPIYALDDLKEEFARQPVIRLSSDLKIMPHNLCYIIYTSGSTGRPKGVEITHQNVCNFLEGVISIYGVESKDRVYQGFSVAFDASIEEIWLAFANGASLVVGASNAVHAGASLVEFLNLHEITVLSTIPTLLSMLDGELPNLRLLILGGEVCPRDLITRWSRPGLRILNTYGPTETTIVATYHECDPEKPITIGKPLPHYDAFIFDEHLQPVEHGTIGELYIGGRSLARGYVNKPELTQQKFISHPLEPSVRLYKTGDLAVQMPGGEIQFMGRADEQVKLRGFRIELSEIENVLLEDQNVRKAVVALQELSPGVQSLVAYILLKDSAALVDAESLTKLLHGRLPDYMVPTLFESITEFPVLPSGKIDRNSLPKPKMHHDAMNKDYIAPETETEKKITKIYEELFKHSPVSINANFFSELGGHSLFAAKAVSILRKEPEMQHMSMLDIYENPTIQQLAEKYSHYKKEQATDDQTKTVDDIKDVKKRYWFCTLGQAVGSYIQYALLSWQFLLIFLTVTIVIDKYTLFSLPFLWLVLSLSFGLPVALLAIAILSKWILLGRIKPGKHRLWGWYYLRWWLVQRIQQIAPIELIAGSPLMNLYCRLMGAKLGKGCYIGTRDIGIFDILKIGDQSSIGYEVNLNGYIVEDGWLKIGSISIGKRCFVGARSVLNLNTVLSDNSMLEDLSMLTENSVIPEGACYEGSPARLLADTARKQESLDWIEPSLLRTMGFGILHYLGLVLVTIVYYAAFVPALLLIDHFYLNDDLVGSVLIAAPIGAFLFIFLLCLSTIVVKKIFLRKTTQGKYKTLSIFYLRNWLVERFIDLWSLEVLADSLYFPVFLRLLGAKIGKRVEVAELPHISPDLLTMEDESFVASAALMGVARIYSGYATFAPVSIGERAFVGNVALLPPGTKLGRKVLIGALSIPPQDGSATKPDTAWFGSPAVFLPRREIFEGFSEKETYYPPKSLYIKRLVIEFIRIILPSFFWIVSLIAMFKVTGHLYYNYSLLNTILLFPLFYFVIMFGLTLIGIGIKWLVIGKLRAASKAVWSVFIWKYDLTAHLYDEFTLHALLNPLMGTPFAAFFLRLLGAKIGKRAFINTLDFTEFDLIEIGDDVALNSNCIIQTHLYEDRIFKMGPIKISDGCAVGNVSVVLYNTIMEKNSSLGSLSLLMKGEILPHDSHWAGIPAQHISKYASTYTSQKTQWEGVPAQISTA